MTDIVINDCPWLYLHNAKAYTLRHPWLKNYKPHDFPYGLSKYYRLDVAARQAWQASQK